VIRAMVTSALPLDSCDRTVARRSLKKSESPGGASAFDFSLARPPASFDPTPQSATRSFRSCSHDAVIRVYDEAGNVIETHEHAGQFKE